MTLSDDPFSAPLAAGDRFLQPRTVPRYEMTWLTELFEPIGGARFMTSTHTVSVKGCCVHSPVRFDTNTVVRLRFQWREEEIEVWARVTGAFAPGMVGFAFLGNRGRDVFARWINAETVPAASL